MPDPADFQTVFIRLKAILQNYAPTLKVIADEPGNYYLNGPFSELYRKELFFAGVRIQKHYVSYHLMPVYMYVDLLDGISPELKKRMQGKSCFNFKSIDESLFNELAQLTRRGAERFRAENGGQPRPT